MIHSCTSILKSCDLETFVYRDVFKLVIYQSPLTQRVAMAHPKLIRHAFGDQQSCNLFAVDLTEDGNRDSTIPRPTMGRAFLFCEDNSRHLHQWGLVVLG